MFTPEFINQEAGEVVLVSNHALATSEAVELSIIYNRARITHGRSQLPDDTWLFRLVYDVRGQELSPSVEALVRNGFEGVCQVEFKR